jgi:hypothetical protein
MYRPALRRILGLAAIASAAGLASCYEVENGPAFAGGDEVPGLEATLYTVARISPSDGDGLLPVDPDDMETWHVRRALNGTYFMTQDGEEDDEEMAVRPRLIEGGDYVIEFSTASDENWLGILNVSGDGAARQYAFCISLNWDDEDVAALAPAHHVRATDQRYGGISFDADDPDVLFSFMADLRGRTELFEWECTVMGLAPPEGFAHDDSDKAPPKN